MTSSPCITQVDLRESARESRPARIAEVLRGLSPGDSTELIDDTDPQPLLLQLGKSLPGQFTWDASQVDADLWVTRLAKAPAAHSEGRCCGACGGT